MLSLKKNILIGAVMLMCGIGSAGAQPLAVVQESNLCGVINEQGNFIVPLSYDRVVPWSNGALKKKKGDSCGVLNADGQIIVPVEYLNILIPDYGNVYLVENNEAHWGAYSTDGKLVLSIAYDEITAADMVNDCFAVRQGTVWKFINSKGLPLSNDEFDYVGEFSQEGLAVIRQKDKWGYATAQGKIKIQPQFDSAQNFSGGLAAVKQQGKWGFIDELGVVRIAPQFSEVYSGFSEGLAAVKSDKGKGYIEKHGNLLIPRDSRYIGPFKDGVAEIHEVKKKLNLWSSLAYGASIAFGSIGLPPKDVLKSNEKRGFINRQGKEVAPTSYDAIIPFANGMALVLKNKKWGAVNKEGEKMIPPQYLDMRSFGSGVAAVRTESGWKLVDKTGQVVNELPEQVTDAGTLSEGLLPVCVDGKWGYINQEGEFVVAPRFTQAGSFVNSTEKVAERTALVMHK